MNQLQSREPAHVLVRHGAAHLSLERSRYGRAKMLPDGTLLEEVAYDEDGNLLTKTDGSGARSNYFYDYRGNVRKSIESERQQGAVPSTTQTTVWCASPTPTDAPLNTRMVLAGSSRASNIPRG
ncbi:MAG: RHS repeat protein [Polyangiaceae bacterium]